MKQIWIVTAMAWAWIISVEILANLIGLKALLLIIGPLALLGLYWLVKCAVERRADRRTLQRVLAQEPKWSRRDWALPAPESNMLLRGVKRGSTAAFKLGLLQLVAAGVMRPDEGGASEGGRGGETILRRGSAPPETVTGSLAAIYGLWAASPDPTIKEIARRAKQEYGSLDRFADQVVVPQLVKAGLYARVDQMVLVRTGEVTRAEGKDRAVLTQKGGAARADLESQMAGVLHEMRLQGGSRVDRKPRQVLMAAVIGVAAGRRMPLEQRELQLVGRQVEQGATATMARQDDSGLANSGFEWQARFDSRIFDNFDRYFGAVDSGCDAGAGGGDGGGGDGGGGGDCGGGGGGE